MISVRKAEEDPHRPHHLRYAEFVPCPCCSGDLFVRGTCQRKVRRITEHSDGEFPEIWCLRVMQCRQCRKTHRELPDWIIPYKRCSAEMYAEIAEDNEKVCCDGTTIAIVRLWVEWFLIYARHIVEAMKILYPGFSPIPDNKPLAERLMYFVRLVVNSGNWVHNRSAYLGAE